MKALAALYLLVPSQLVSPMVKSKAVVAARLGGRSLKAAASDYFSVYLVGTALVGFWSSAGWAEGPPLEYEQIFSARR